MVFIVFFVTFIYFQIVSTNIVKIPVPYEIEVAKESSCKIFCINSYESVGPTNVWKNIKVQAVCKNTKDEKDCSNPGIIVAENEEPLRRSCTKGWLPRYAPWQTNHASVSPFQNVCFAVVNDSMYKLTVTPYTAHLFYIALFVFGLVLFICAPALSQNLLFYYSSGITIGIFASLIILVYILSRMIPRKSGAFAVIALGWSGALCILRWVFENLTDTDYQQYIMGYIGLSALISFAVCYYYGPSYHERAQKLVQWAIQICALICIHQSTHDENASLIMVIGLLTFKIIPFDPMCRFLRNIKWKWKQEKKHRFLTEEEYEEQARKETKLALEELRKRCLTPEVETWKTVSRLESPKRFARFVLGDSHLSGDELSAYDSDISLIDDDDDDIEDNTSDIMTDDLSYQEEAVVI